MHRIPIKTAGVIPQYTQVLPGTLGAALLAAEAAGRGGAGLVTLFCDTAVYTAAASRMRSVMVRPWNGNAPENLEKYQSCVIGPGWGIDGREGVFKKLLESSRRGVIDADGLSLLSGTRGPGRGVDPDAPSG